MPVSKNKSSNSELSKNMGQKFDQGKSHTTKMLTLLNSVIERDGNEAESLMELYDLYCEGYEFLTDLGLGIGLFIKVPWTYGKLNYSEINQEQKNELLNRAYPIAKELAEELRIWLIKKELILTGEREILWKFIDNRKEEDKKSRIWEDPIIHENKVITQRNILLDKNGNFIGSQKQIKNSDKNHLKNKF